MALLSQSKRNTARASIVLAGIAISLIIAGIVLCATGVGVFSGAMFICCGVGAFLGSLNGLPFSECHSTLQSESVAGLDSSSTLTSTRLLSRPSAKNTASKSQIVSEPSSFNHFTSAVSNFFSRIFTNATPEEDALAKAEEKRYPYRI